MLRSLALLVTVFGLTPSAWAYKNFGHERMTRDTLKYLRTQPRSFEETAKWLDANIDQTMLEEQLVRANVENDYVSTMWLGAIFHPPFAGGEKDGWVNMFNTFYHFINITQPGQYWEYDGLSYKGSTRRGNDKLLDSPTLTLRSQYSRPLGGAEPKGEVHGFDLGRYDLGFRGTEKEWAKLYKKGRKVSETVFPPANVPAELAMSKLMSSARVKTASKETWTEDLELVEGVLSQGKRPHLGWRAEIAGLPSAFDLLGVPVHMIQDMTVTHHGMGTSDLCHHEYEFLVDRLICPGAQVDYDAYHDGTYTGDMYPSCASLYDPALIKQLVSEIPALDPKSEMTLSHRLQEVAKESNRWRWLPYGKGVFMVYGNGGIGVAERCELIDYADGIQDQVKRQYNLAVAASVMVFELAAHGYEKARQ